MCYLGVIDLILLYMVSLGHGFQAEALQFIRLTDAAAWTPRVGPQVSILHSPISYNYNFTAYTAPEGSIILYGGASNVGLTSGLNDIWTNLEGGKIWRKIVEPKINSVFPQGRMSTRCNDPLTDRSYAILEKSDMIYRSPKIPVMWVSDNQTYWWGPTLNSTDFLTDRFGSSCVVDSQSNLYYFSGANFTTLRSKTPQMFSDLWQIKIEDQVHTWTRRSNNSLVLSRYQALVGVHRKNTALGGRDILYVSGGRSFNGSESYRLSDLWASSDTGTTWTSIQIIMPWDAMNNTPLEIGGMYITDKGLLIASVITSAYWNASSDLWLSFDGGLTWSACYSNVSYGPRISFGMTLGLDGKVYVIGGLNLTAYRSGVSSMTNDVWISDISFDDLSLIAESCGQNLPNHGAGLQSWPGAETETTVNELSNRKVIVIVVPIILGVFVIFLLFAALRYFLNQKAQQSDLLKTHDQSGIQVGDFNKLPELSAIDANHAF